jgi:hypothetical protein
MDMKKSTISTVVMTSVGLLVGIAEAFLYYNLGKNEGEKFSYKLPPKKQFLKTVGIVLATSFITAGISAFIESQINNQMADEIPQNKKKAA